MIIDSKSYVNKMSWVITSQQLTFAHKVKAVCCFLSNLKFYFKCSWQTFFLLLHLDYASCNQLGIGMIDWLSTSDDKGEKTEPLIPTKGLVMLGYAHCCCHAKRVTTASHAHPNFCNLLCNTWKLEWLKVQTCGSFVSFDTFTLHQWGNIRFLETGMDETSTL